MNDDKINLALESLIKVQKKIIKNVLLNDYYLSKFISMPNNVTDEKINLLLLNNGDANLTLQAHKFLISKIIYNVYFKKNKISIQELSNYFYCFNQSEIDLIPIDVSVEKIIGHLGNKDTLKLIEALHINYLNTQCIFKEGELLFEKSKINFAEKGSVYTDDYIAKNITHTTIKNKLKEGLDANNLNILDFGCGTGRFYLNAFEYLSSKLKINKRKIISHHLCAIDIDPIAIDILKIKVFNLLEQPLISDLELISESIINKNMLIPDDNVNRDSPIVVHKSNFEKVISNGGFNVIVSNPPYFLLKVNSNKKRNASLQSYYNNLKIRIENEVKFFRNSDLYEHSIEGMLNYYKLSIEMMLKIASKNAELGIICPSTLFADLSSKKLRKWLLLENNVREIEYFSESARLFEGISQSTVIFHLQKNNITEKINIKSNDQNFYISLNLIHDAFGENYEIPYINKKGWSIIKKLSKFKTIKDCEGIRNKRGELDLTLHKKYITEEPTGWRLVRGNMISSKGLVNKKQECVDIDGFLESKSIDYIKNDFNKRRLVCQQISNVDIAKRLNFVVCEDTDILGNSCNYMSIKDENYLENLRLVLNSFLLNWRFKITSSNNHINNYELDELPMIDFTKIDLLDLDELDNNLILAKLYGLNKSETIYILKEHFDLDEIDKRWKN